MYTTNGSYLRQGSGATQTYEANTVHSAVDYS